MVLYRKGRHICFDAGPATGRWFAAGTGGAAGAVQTAGGLLQQEGMVQQVHCRLIDCLCKLVGHDRPQLSGSEANIEFLLFVSLHDVGHERQGQ